MGRLENRAQRNGRCVSRRIPLCVCVEALLASRVPVACERQGRRGVCSSGSPGASDFGLDGRNPRALDEDSSAQLGRAAPGAAAMRPDALDARGEPSAQPPTYPVAGTGLAGIQIPCSSFFGRFWHRRAIEARRCPRGVSTSAETLTAEHRPTRHRPLHDRRAVVACGANGARAPQAPSHPRAKRAHQRAAEGARPCQTHKGAPARQGAVRVMGGRTRCGRSRASSRPRWPDDAKTFQKIY